MPNAIRIHPDLPIFRLDAGEKTILYTPQHVVRVSRLQSKWISEVWRGGGRRAGNREEAAALSVAEQLETRARQMVESWQQWSKRPFEPECLTVYLSNHCNLGCHYCYVRASGKKGLSPVIEEESVMGAARWVAQACARNGKPFRIVFHGGGEPTCHWGLLERFVAGSRRIAEAHGIDWWGYLATNGMFSKAKARWLARHFNLIGLSCDGPPEIHDRQRPQRNGRGSWARLERTMGSLMGAGAHIVLRSTITPLSLDHQAELVTFLKKQMGSTALRFEPAYGLSAPGSGPFSPGHAERFVKHFLAAQREATLQGVDLTYSGVRLDELHGPYCDVLRNALHLTWNGKATACFFSTDGHSGAGSDQAIGEADRSTGQFRMIKDRIEWHRKRALEIPDRCSDCINTYHCARECPQVCSVSQRDELNKAQPGFRCLVNRQLAEAWITQAATAVPDSAMERGSRTLNAQEKTSDRQDPSTFLAPVAHLVDTRGVLRQWQAVKGRMDIEKRSLPSPVWAGREFEHRGEEAWQALVRGQPSLQGKGPISVYIHVPFCDRKCKFCDCHAFPLSKSNPGMAEDYCRALLNELPAWVGVAGLAQRPVTAVHLGGGTPNCLSRDLFEHIVDGLRKNLTITDRTEWASETTSALLKGPHLEWLRGNGFRRLHVGVQTLEDPVRAVIGRREEAKAVLKGLASALDTGFVVSADIIYGLPLQTFHGLVTTLEQLTALGVHGFSLYELQVTSRNRAFLARHQAASRDAFRNYLAFHCTEAFLTQRGYRKKHFVHFGLPEETYLYYTHALRGEDLLALGPSADGVLGHYLYRHQGYRAYVDGAQAAGPPLEGGMWESHLERTLRPARNMLMGGKINRSLLRKVGADTLITAWREAALIRKDEDGPDDYVLTGNGSWFLSRMIEEMSDMVAAPVP
jgi:coproporphyrinogen III oxidase-like Fe-S oxidoreductase/sulfatase maturation enzyme AslB (radical SAM superfamily)